jgi:ABC-type phosphonate transport system ATPase subunit
MASTKISFDEVANVFSKKIESWKNSKEIGRSIKISENRNIIFGFSSESLNQTIDELHKRISKDQADIYAERSLPDSKNYFWFTNQIVDYAKRHNYLLSRTHPRGWFKINFVLSEHRQYQLIISVHHYGTEDSTIAFGAFLEYIELDNNDKNSDKKQSGYIRKRQNNNIITSLPLSIKPHIISLEEDIGNLEVSLKAFLQDTVRIALGQIASEIR